MKKIVLLSVFVILASVIYFNLKPSSISQNQPSEKPTVLPTPIKENTYADAYFDFSLVYPTNWTIETKMSKNRGCEMAKIFLRIPNCTTENLTTETLYINSPEKDVNNKPFGITIETATEGLGFACIDNIEKKYSVSINGKTYSFDACQDFKSKEEWGMGEMEVTGPKSAWKAILVNFSAKDEKMTEEILKILQSFQ